MYHSTMAGHARPDSDHFLITFNFVVGDDEPLAHHVPKPSYYSWGQANWQEYSRLVSEDCKRFPTKGTPNQQAKFLSRSIAKATAKARDYGRCQVRRLGSESEKRALDLEPRGQVNIFAPPRSTCLSRKHSQCSLAWPSLAIQKVISRDAVGKDMHLQSALTRDIGRGSSKNVRLVLPGRR